jgi:ribosomal-protein-alanine N-acetyltransferase
MNPAIADLRIRSMALADLEPVMEIAQSLESAPHWPRSAYAAALDPEAPVRRIALVADCPEARSPVGFAVASLLPPHAELEIICVAAKSQRRGVARKIFCELLKELRKAQASEIHLEARASNAPALKFYRAQGFVETGRRARYYADPVDDAVLLELRLS